MTFQNHQKKVKYFNIKIKTVTIVTMKEKIIITLNKKQGTRGVTQHKLLASSPWWIERGIVGLIKQYKY